MTEHMTAEALQASSVSAVALLSRMQKLKIALKALNAKGSKSYLTLYDVENTPQETLDQTSTDGTVFQPIVDALNVQGIITEPNVGSVMRNLEITKHDVHEITCYCHFGATMTASHAANNLAARVSFTDE